MLRKGAIIEYLKKKKLSKATLEKLEKQINSDGNHSKPEEKKTDPTPKKRTPGPLKLIDIDAVHNHAQFATGQRVRFEDGNIYRKGTKYWILTK